MVAEIRLGPQGLAQPALIIGNDTRRRRQDMAGRAVVLLQPNYFRAGKIMFEA
jgi:hypothetical protein